MEDNKRDFNDSDILSTINEKKFDIFHIDEFEGFDVCIPINQEILKKIHRSEGWLEKELWNQKIKFVGFEYLILKIKRIFH